MRTSVHIPDALLADAKRKAAAEGRTLTSLIEEGLRLVLARSHGSANDRRRSRLPLSPHSGGLSPVLDPDKLHSHVQELEDLEYAERLGKGFE